MRAPKKYRRQWKQLRRMNRVGDHRIKMGYEGRKPSPSYMLFMQNILKDIVRRGE